MKRISIALFALLMLFASTTELLAQRKKTTTKSVTEVTKTAPIQEEDETQSQPSIENSVPAKEDDVSPSLEETMNWMKSKLQGNAVFINYITSVKSKIPDASFTSERGETLSYEDVIINQCKLSYKIKSKNFVIVKSYFPEKKDEGSYENRSVIDFSQLDPISIKVEEYKIPTNSQGDVTEMKTKTWVVLITDVMFFPSEEIAKRFHRAAVHATKLCGGKVEPF
jgi:hypothetical protein